MCSSADPIPISHFFFFFCRPVLSPDDVEALKAALYGKMRKGRTAEALKYVERLVAIEPEEVEWRLLLALSFELMGQLGKAKRLFREILKERPLLLRALHMGFVSLTLECTLYV